jgi:hypothetical protein
MWKELVVAEDITKISMRITGVPSDIRTAYTLNIPLKPQ